MWETRAWIYKGDDAYFHGNVKLGYYILWLLLGIPFVVWFAKQNGAKNKNE